MSESVTSLTRKNLIRKVPIGPGRRSRLELTPLGITLTKDLSIYPAPIREVMESLAGPEKMRFLSVLLRVILEFQKQGNLPPVRMCLNCVHFHPHQYGRPEAPHYCDEYDVALATGTLRLECAEYAEAPKAVWLKNWQAVARNASKAEKDFIHQRNRERRRDHAPRSN